MKDTKSPMLRAIELEGNPFPATAVSKLSLLEQDIVSIQTDATNEAGKITKAYLAPASDTNAGQVVAVVGEYGTGKTHIALQMLTEIRANADSQIEAFYLDAPADTFFALYKERFFPQLSKAKVTERVREYYSDIIADDLGRSELTESTAKALRNRTLSPIEAIEQLGLMDSQYRSVLNKQLEKVTEHSDFAMAFTLMLRPDFEHAVWEWLGGQQPDQSLIDRGISRVLDNDMSVIEAIGVFAFLFGRQNWRFVLIIDEMEKVLSPTGKSKSEETILAFKKMMEAVGKTNSMLILVGLPDFLDALPDDAQQRLSSIIRPSSLSPKNVENYISESKKRLNLSSGLKPFSHGVIEYITEIAGGNARKVVRLCFHIYRQAMEADTTATRAMVRAIARNQFELSTAEDVFKDISRVVDANGWLHESPKILELGDQKQKIDFWLNVGGNGDGCAIFVDNSILDANSSNKLIDKTKAIASLTNSSQVLTLLIVNGHLAENLRKPLEKEFDRVLVNTVRSFPEDLEAILKGMIRRIEEKTDKETISKVLERVEQISRQLNVLRREFRDQLDDVSQLRRTEAVVERVIFDTFRTMGERKRAYILNNVDANAAFDGVKYLIAQLLTVTDNIDEGFTGKNDKTSYERQRFLEMLERKLEGFRSNIYDIENLFNSNERKMNTMRFSFRDALADKCSNFDREIEQLNHLRFSIDDFHRSFRKIDRRTRGGYLDLTEDLIHRLQSMGRTVYDAYDRF